ncbi:3-keto-disaccharide hydrolase [Aegicerativicinus sediminis]|uniref:3-keto-disaccharide hydrolase n=1 Tax=Aegicerativicinus sediminis TaxID=2893202 RepID=UPI001E31E8F7|nr:DUF1080 domain-containing protein [Aegicerativicinus sediminis]
MRNIQLILLTLVLVLSCKDKSEDETLATEKFVDEEVKVEENDWIYLFDGTNLDHWRGYLADSIYANWTIEQDGTLMFTPDPEGYKNIITKDTYESFILSLDWRISEGGNSGIFWAVSEEGKRPEAYETGPEIQILDNERHPDAKVAGGTHKAGSLYDLVAYPPEAINPAGEWNSCLIEINYKENKGSISINGNEPITFPVQGDEWQNMLDNSKFKGWEYFGKYHKGHIGLQDHGNKVWFRNIKIKPF